LSHTSRTATEEIFGPVVTLHSFDNEDEAVAMANATEYGLAGSVWTKDAKRGHAFGQRLDTGIVWVNTWLNRDLRTPFGGVKQSGVGREGG
ncbi:MAG TPA: aldehyde dehydrogenase family protein, partial [Candidatus Poseidoniales archaeon]